MGCAQRVAGRRAVRYDFTCDPATDRWYLDASWKHDYNNIAQMSPEELARRRREFDAQKEIARGIRESAA